MTKIDHEKLNRVQKAKQYQPDGVVDEIDLSQEPMQTEMNAADRRYLVEDKVAECSKIIAKITNTVAREVCGQVSAERYSTKGYAEAKRLLSEIKSLDVENVFLKKHQSLLIETEIAVLREYIISRPEFVQRKDKLIHDELCSKELELPDIGALLKLHSEVDKCKGKLLSVARDLHREYGKQINRNPTKANKIRQVEKALAGIERKRKPLYANLKKMGLRF